VLVLAGALVLSWLATKFVNFRRQRLLLRQHIDDLGSDWFPQERQLPTVVATRALLGQARRLTQRTWLSGPDSIEKKIKQATPFVEIFRKAAQFRTDLQKAGLQPFVMVRPIVALRRIVAGLQGQPIDEAKRQAVLAEIDALRVWLQPAQVLNLYSNGVKQDAEQIWSCIDLRLVQDQARHTVLQTVKTNCTPVAGDDLRQIVVRDENCARLKVLWDRRDRPESDHLWTYQGNSKTFLDVADKDAWEGLKAAAANRNLVIEAPPQQEEYAAVSFIVKTGDSVLDNTFLLKHGLKYRWNWDIDGEVLVPEEVTDGPLLTQFSPKTGTMKATVGIHYGNETLRADSSPVIIGKSKEFKTSEGFEATEIMATGLAMIIAIGTGLATQYFANPTFGAWRDYLNLALWGIGVDQAKNAWQVFQNYSSWPKP
jgi:hypothetical protein